MLTPRRFHEQLADPPQDPLSLLRRPDTAERLATEDACGQAMRKAAILLGVPGLDRPKIVKREEEDAI